jgi:hypothetical protein
MNSSFFLDKGDHWFFFSPFSFSLKEKKTRQLTNVHGEGIFMFDEVILLWRM